MYNYIEKYSLNTTTALSYINTFVSYL